jgi:hypothetical protein
VLAALANAGTPSITRVLTGGDEFSWFSTWGGWLSLVAFAALGYMLIGIPLHARNPRAALPVQQP